MAGIVWPLFIGIQPTPFSGYLRQVPDRLRYRCNLLPQNLEELILGEFYLIGLPPHRSINPLGIRCRCMGHRRHGHERRESLVVVPFLLAN